MAPEPPAADPAALQSAWQRLMHLKSLGQFDQALAIAIPLLDTLRRQPTSDEDLSEVASTTGILLRQLGRYPEAETLYLEALALRRRAFGNEHPAVAATLNNLGVLYFAQRRFEEAEASQREAVAIKERLRGSGDVDVAVSLSGLAATLLERGQLGEAEALLSRALEIQRREPGPRIIETLHNLSALCARTRRFDEMVSYAREAHEAASNLLPAGHPTILESLRTLAARCRETGRFAEALPHYRRIAAALEAALGPAHDDTVRATIWLGQSFFEQGDYQNAERAFEHALAGVGGTGIPRPELTLACRSNLALVYRAIGSLDRAARLLEATREEAGTVLGPAHPDTILIVNSLAALYRQMGRRSLSQSLLEDAIALHRQHGADPETLSAALNNLAMVLLEEGNFAGADPLFREALVHARTAHGDGHQAVATLVNNLAEVSRETGNYAEAERLQLDANRRYLLVRGDTHASIARGLHNLAKTYGATSRYDEALAAELRAAAIDDELLARVFSFGSEQARRDFVATVTGALDALVSLVVQKFPESAEAARAALDVVLRRKAIGMEAITTQRQAVLAGGHGHLGPELAELNRLRTEIARRIVAHTGSGGAPPSDLVALELQRDRLEEQLARQLPRVDAERSRRSGSTTTVSQSLPPGSVLIELIRFQARDWSGTAANRQPEWRNDRYAAFTVHAGEADRVTAIDLGEADPIDQAIRSLRQEIVNHFATRRAGPAVDPVERHQLGWRLRTLVFDPLRHAIGGRTRLLIAPDGELTRIPFELLPLEHGRLIIDDFEVSYLTCGRDLSRLGVASEVASGPPLVVADPDFDLAARTASPPAASDTGAVDRASFEGRRFPRLPGTRVEGEVVAGLLGVEPLMDRDAIESRIKAARSPRILHVASHGYFLPSTTQWAKRDETGIRVLAVESSGDEDRVVMMAGRTADGAFGFADVLRSGRLGRIGRHEPMVRSGIALAGANTWLRNGSLPEEAEDALLTATDVASLDLRGTELVVLSACETGLGEVHLSEGVQGLRRACVLAGARTLMMSLWKVPDHQTRLLMEAMYTRLLEGSPRSTALREAQLEVRAQYPDPLFWAAFVCEGDPGPLAPPRAAEDRSTPRRADGDHDQLG